MAHTGPCAVGQVVTCEADGGRPGHTAPGSGCTPGDSERMTVPLSAMRLCFLNLGPAKGARALWLTAGLSTLPRGHTRLVELVRVTRCPWCCCERPSRSGGGCGCPSVGVRPGPPPQPAPAPHGGSGGPQCCVLSWTRISPGAVSWSCDGEATTGPGVTRVLRAERFPSTGEHRRGLRVCSRQCVLPAVGLGSASPSWFSVLPGA